MASINDWINAANNLKQQTINDYVNKNQGLLNSINSQRDAELAGLANSNQQALNKLAQDKNTVNETALNNAKAANVNRLLALRDNKNALSRAGLSSQGLVGSQVNSINNNYGTNLNTILKDKATGLRDIENQINNTNLTYDTNKQNLTAQYASTLAQQQAAINNAAQQLGMQAYNDYISQQQAYANYEQQKAEAERQYQLQLQQLRSSASGSNWSDGGGGYAVNTAYYQGDLNPDARNGTFSNGYQPNNVNGVKLSKTSNTITFNTKTLSGQKQTVTQNIWKAGKKYYYWDGRYNRYIQCTKTGKKV